MMIGSSLVLKFEASGIFNKKFRLFSNMAIACKMWNIIICMPFHIKNILSSA
jgi:hypothetical protein